MGAVAFAAWHLQLVVMVGIGMEMEILDGMIPGLARTLAELAMKTEATLRRLERRILIDRWFCLGV